MTSNSNFSPAPQNRHVPRRPSAGGADARGDWRRLAGAFLAAALLLAAPAAPALSDPSGGAPGFFDPHARPAKPDLGALRSLRFLTEDDYPPFHFALADGSLAGFDIDLARAICEDLKLSCTIQARRFDTLIDSLQADEGDAVIASIRVDEKTRALVDFTAPYFRSPARFATLKPAPLTDASPETLRGKFVGVIAKTAHEAYLETFFKAASLKTYDTQKALTAALVNGEVDAIFADGVGLSVWLRGESAHDCCAFLGGPFLDARFFGEGVAVAVRKGDAPLRDAIDYALADLWAKGVYTDLYLKYFPLGVY